MTRPALTVDQVAAREEALDEAARVALDRAAHHAVLARNGETPMVDLLLAKLAQSIAAKIRSLK